MRPHRKLDVWNEAMDLVVALYEITGAFPKTEQYALADQLRRAAVSIPSNIAEGAARQTKKEFVQFLHIARGSASEIDTQMEVAHRLNYISNETKRGVDARLDAIGRMLTGLIRSVRGRDS